MKEQCELRDPWIEAVPKIHFGHGVKITWSNNLLVVVQTTTDCLVFRKEIS